jgi:hypothetical protein
MPTDSSVCCLGKSNSYLVHTIGAACARKSRTSGARECGRPSHRIRRSDLDAMVTGSVEASCGEGQAEGRASREHARCVENHSYAVRP